MIFDVKAQLERRPAGFFNLAADFFSTCITTGRIVVARRVGNGIIPNVFRIPFSAEVAKSVDAVDSKSTAARRAGSIPAFGTIVYENRPQLRSFFVSKIQQLRCLSPVLYLLTSTHIYPHIPTNDGITGGIFGWIDFDTNNGGINRWHSMILKFKQPNPPTNPSNSLIGRECTC